MSARPITALDVELFYTGQATHPFVMYSDLLDFVEMQKAVGTLSAATTGVLNRIFGALIWTQLNSEANWFGLLPKTTWVRSGWRVKTGFSTTNVADVAVSETSTLPNPRYPDIRMVYENPKIHVLTFEVTDVVEALASVSEDDVWGAAYQMRAEMGVDFVKILNIALGSKVNEAPGSWNALEKIDRIVAKDGEQGLGPGYANVHGIDRSTETWANAYVNDSADLRSLTDDLIIDLLVNTRARGANTNVLVTGYDTYGVLQALYMTFVRYLPMGETQVSFGVNGIQTATGINAGIHVASLRGIPLIQTIDIAKGTGANEISYIYALDTSDPEGYGLPRLGISVLRPVEYFESRDYVLLNKFVVKGVYRFMGQTIGRFLRGQGKLRDITS
ncbi:MAG: hypothetical protein QXF58_05105 [Desulfurococcaceae archaeon]